MPLVALLDGPEGLAAVRALSPAQRATWHALQRELDETSMHGPFDRRHYLTLDVEGQRRWEAQRQDWIRLVVATDPRVVQP